MKRSEREAKETLKAHGKIVTTRGITEGGGHHQEDAPTTSLKHGLIARALGLPPKEVKGEMSLKSLQCPAKDCNSTLARTHCESPSCPWWECDNERHSHYSDIKRRSFTRGVK